VKTLDLVLRSDFDSATCAQKLGAEFDIDQFTLFSLSRYRGGKPIVGRIVGHEFRLHKRRYWRNDFAPVLYGRLVIWGKGTHIEAYWDTRRLQRIAIRIWTILAALIGLPIFIQTLRELMTGASLEQDNNWLGLIVPLVLVSWGLLLPHVGAALSFRDKPFIVETLQRALTALQIPVESKQRDWNSTLS
jgi:hypothetical protein